MKFRTTAKAIREGCAPYYIYSVGYCDLQWTLKAEDAIAYTCGTYGWNFDVYNIGGFAICTGYRGMPGDRLEGVAELERYAREIWTSDRDWDEKKTLVHDELMTVLGKNLAAKIAREKAKMNA